MKISILPFLLTTIFTNFLIKKIRVKSDSQIKITTQNPVNGLIKNSTKLGVFNSQFSLLEDKS